jgi:hypothetical protein
MRLLFPLVIGAAAIFLVLRIGGGLLMGFKSRPDEWYVKLSKPCYATGACMDLLYVMIAIVESDETGQRRKSEAAPVNLEFQ